MNATTHQTVSVTSKEGRAFLRKVAKTRQDWSEEWNLYANSSDGWKLTFSRSVKGVIGEPDVYLTVETDAIVSQEGETGLCKAFEDSREVMVPAATRVWLRGPDARTAARFLLDGWRFTVLHSTGSTISSRHGLAFVSLHAEKRGTKQNDNWDTVEIGGSTTLVNGVIVCRGAVT